MVKLRASEKFLLHSICKKNQVPVELVMQLLKDASRNSYENRNEKERIREYRNLISFHFKEGN